MRETLKLLLSVMDLLRITPAYAGNTQMQDSIYRVAAGSPPRMRETPVNGNRFDISLGITPAYAGNTDLVDYGCSLRQDHPRVCGKH